MRRMTPGLSSFYAEYRLRSGAVRFLREDRDSPPERLLQAAWQHQRLRRDQLRTLDGQRVTVLHPGFMNLEGGPDFRGAVIQFADDAPLSGDVEVDLRSTGWRGHGHDRNPAFKGVILHVVWEAERQAEGGPATLVLNPVLDAPIGELSLWLGGEGVEAFPQEFLGKCCAPLRHLEPDGLAELLRQAAQVRLAGKAAQFSARARQVGWEQALWEGLFRALGYKHNVWPMQRVAELRPRWSSMTANDPADRVPLNVFQARLFGVSGLLPTELKRADGAEYWRHIWDEWWREREGLADCILPRALWTLHGIRPANRPERRLALGAHWVWNGTVPGKLQAWCAREVKNLPGSLLDMLQSEPDEYWSWHWGFGSARLGKPQPLLGTTRVTDLAVNVVLPWLWARTAGTETGKDGLARAEEAGPAAEFRGETSNSRGREAVRCEIERRYYAWPAAEDNSVLRLARRRLLRNESAREFRTAAAQQGLIQVVRDFCEHSNSVCDGCKLPGLVEEFGKG